VTYEIFIFYCCLHNITVIGPPDVSWEGLKFYPWTFFSSFFFFLSIHRAQQPRSGRPSNVFRRFDQNWWRDLAHAFPNFQRGSKSAKFGVVFNVT